MDRSINQESSMHSSSNQEADQLEQENIGIGRLYECVFCQRGFNTAQALGGHMNIHRRDRAKNKPAMLNSHREEQTNTGMIFFPQVSSNPPPYFPYQDVQTNYPTFTQADSTSDQRPQFARHFFGSCEQNSPIVRPLDLILGFEGEDRKENKGIDTEKEEHELDLELRLGHNP